MGKELQAPRNVKFISQSCTESSLWVTVLDKDTNEIVLLNYGQALGGTKLWGVIKTGMNAQPDEVVKVSGGDAPHHSN